MKVKEESDKVGSKLKIQKTKIIESGPITSWQIDGGNSGNSERLCFGGLRNHCDWLWLQMWLHLWLQTDGDYNLEIKRCLPLGRKAMTNRDSMLKSRDMMLPTKIRLVKSMAFLVVMYGCESWTLKKTEHQRIDAFELWCWRRLLRVPWMARRSSQSILKEISPE